MGTLVLLAMLAQLILEQAMPLLAYKHHDQIIQAQQLISLYLATFSFMFLT
ncbi:hypothetical protein PCARR_a0564 [Pseudoalteromonas carrageenovora IAM 12662]|uniref:Uncharacterized protein n=1 Tax=Pseudoalteromonas carrageenovora IAM 12662 TaxID=1314868 RepID=A0ABR9ENY2_PSEVC|nr:hypothetical protein [Pseudoalteromonas carrageenovora IAM 12662]